MSNSPETNDYQQLVEQLHHPGTRRAARQKLVAAGAVGPLLECLGSPNESVVWAAVQSLGELHAAEAVAPLLDLLARGRLAVDICEALTRITGQDFGADVRQWRNWVEKSDAGKAPGLDVADCVRRTAEYLGSAGPHSL